MPENSPKAHRAISGSARDFSQGFTSAIFALARALLRTNGRTWAPKNSFREAIAGALAISAALRALGSRQRFCWRKKKYEAGTDALAEYLKLNPGDRAEHFERALPRLMEIDRYDDALAELDRAENRFRAHCRRTQDARRHLSAPGKMEGSQ